MERCCAASACLVSPSCPCSWAGCTTPAVMAARTMENEKDRRMTIMLTPASPAQNCRSIRSSRPPSSAKRRSFIISLYVFASSCRSLPVSLKDRPR
ncbi:MAG: hypothetical protein ACLUB2_02915 [Butyricicoccus pullicaecorum]